MPAGDPAKQHTISLTGGLACADFTRRFLPMEVLNAFAVLQPHFWCQEVHRGNCAENGFKEDFITDIEAKFTFLLSKYGTDILFPDNTVVPAALDGESAKLEWQDFLFFMSEGREQFLEGCTTGDWWGAQLRPPPGA